MTCDPEACRAPSGQEEVRPVPAVEADAEGLVFQDAVHFSESGFEPEIIVIVPDVATGTVAIVHEIGRVGQDEINAPGRKSGHEPDAIAHDRVNRVQASGDHAAFKELTIHADCFHRSSLIVEDELEIRATDFTIPNLMRWLQVYANATNQPASAMKHHLPTALHGICY